MRRRLYEVMGTYDSKALYRPWQWQQTTYRRLVNAEQQVGNRAPALPENSDCFTGLEKALEVLVLKKL